MIGTSQYNEQGPSSRQERRLQEQQKKESVRQEKQETNREKKPRLRLIPIWVRLIIVVLLLVLGFAIGLMVGYGIIGDGNPDKALDQSTWQHIVDLVIKK